MTLATRPNGREKKRRRRVGEKPEGRSKPPGSDDRRGVSRGSCDCLMDGKSEWAMASEVSLALAHGSRWPGEGDPVWQQSRAPGGSGISARRDRQGTDERGQKKDDEVVSAEADNEAAVVMGREREREGRQMDWTGRQARRHRARARTRRGPARAVFSLVGRPLLGSFVPCRLTVVVRLEKPDLTTTTTIYGFAYSDCAPPDARLSLPHLALWPSFLFFFFFPVCPCSPEWRPCSLPTDGAPRTRADPPLPNLLDAALIGGPELDKHDSRIHHGSKPTNPGAALFFLFLVC